jgi:TetR/AcrR family transcriptional regulator, transcriptional repressor for nem operon
MSNMSEFTPTAERILDFAEGLIQQYGYNGFSYDDIARLVGIKKPSIHHHFQSKSVLVAAVATRYTERFTESLQRIEAKHTQARTRLTAYAALFEQTYANDRKLCVCGMLGAGQEDLPEEAALAVRNFFETNLQWLSHVIASASQGKRVTREQTSVRALTLLCALEGAMVVGRGLASEAGPSLVTEHAIDCALL